ncbi:Phosphoinositide-Interacting Protein [Manis pentadactyla]|nr:Phosphoinositide-Interacting Protein [Manis pentadactyla]
MAQKVSILYTEAPLCASPAAAAFTISVVTPLRQLGETRLRFSAYTGCWVEDPRSRWSLNRLLQISLQIMKFGVAVICLCPPRKAKINSLKILNGE